LEEPVATIFSEEVKMVETGSFETLVNHLQDYKGSAHNGEDGPLIWYGFFKTLTEKKENQ
jgi:hypothetical protein